MTIRMRSLGAVALGLFLSFSAPPAMAATAKVPAASVMVVDIPKVISESRQTKKIRETRETFAEKFRKEFDAEGAKLREEEKQITDQRTVLSPEAFVEKQKAFNAKAASFEKRTRIRFLSLDTATDTAMKQVGMHLAQIIRELAGEVGANIVLSRTQIEYFDPATDKTDIALERLNTKVKEITFPNPMEVEKELQNRVDAEAAKRQGAAAKDAKKK